MCQILTKFGVSRHIFKFQGSPTSESRAYTFGQTDRQKRRQMNMPI